jgi:hypothetical protein
MTVVFKWLNGKRYDGNERIQAVDRRSDLAMPMISSDYKAYECPVTGNMIEGRRAHSENLKVTGCRLHEKGEFEDVKKNGKKYVEARMDLAIDKAVDEVARDLLV